MRPCEGGIKGEEEQRERKGVLSHPCLVSQIAGSCVVLPWP